MTSPQKTFASADNDFKFAVKASATPQYRTDRLVSYLTTVCGLKDVWQTKNLQPLLNRWMGRKDFLSVCKKAGVLGDRLARLDSLLTHLHRHKVKDWVAEVAANAAEGIVEEGTPEQELADTADYWNAYTKSFGKALLRVRAIKHEGTMWFRLGDVAEIAGDKTFGVHVTNYVNRLKGFKTLTSNMYTGVHIQKTTKAVRLFTRKELIGVESRAADEGTRKGDWYVTEKGMERIIATSADKTPQASAFLDHVLEVLHGRQETIAAFVTRRKAARAPEEILDEDSNVLHACRRISKERGANPQAMVGQATVGFLGEKLADFAERHGVTRPHRKNVIREMPDVGDGISSSVRLGNHLTKNSASCVGEVLVGRAYYVAGALTRKNSELDISRAEHLLAAMDRLTLRRALPK